MLNTHLIILQSSHLYFHKECRNKQSIHESCITIACNNHTVSCCLIINHSCDCLSNCAIQPHQHQFHDTIGKELFRPNKAILNIITCSNSSTVTTYHSPSFQHKLLHCQTTKITDYHIILPWQLSVFLFISLGRMDHLKRTFPFELFDFDYSFGEYVWYKCISSLFKIFKPFHHSCTNSSSNDLMIQPIPTISLLSTRNSNWQGPINPFSFGIKGCLCLGLVCLS